MTVVLTFRPPAKRLAQNDRLHWRARARLTKQWREAAYWAAVQGLRSIDRENLGPRFVRVTFPVDTNRRRDSDGPAPTVKAIVDGLVDAYCWPDDTPEYVETLGSRFDLVSPSVTVELIPREAQ